MPAIKHQHQHDTTANSSPKSKHYQTPPGPSPKIIDSILNPDLSKEAPPPAFPSLGLGRERREREYKELRKGQISAYEGVLGERRNGKGDGGEGEWYDGDDDAEDVGFAGFREMIKVNRRRRLGLDAEDKGDVKVPSLEVFTFRSVEMPSTQTAEDEKEKENGSVSEDGDWVTESSCSWYSDQLSPWLALLARYRRRRLGLDLDTEEEGSLSENGDRRTESSSSWYSETLDGHLAMLAEIRLRRIGTPSGDGSVSEDGDSRTESTSSWYSDTLDGYLAMLAEIRLRRIGTPSGDGSISEDGDSRTESTSSWYSDTLAEHLVMMVENCRRRLEMLHEDASLSQDDERRTESSSSWYSDTLAEDLAMLAEIRRRFHALSSEDGSVSEDDERKTESSSSWYSDTLSGFRAMRALNRRRRLGLTHEDGSLSEDGDGQTESSCSWYSETLSGFRAMRALNRRRRLGLDMDHEDKEQDDVKVPSFDEFNFPPLPLPSQNANSKCSRCGKLMISTQDSEKDQESDNQSRGGSLPSTRIPSRHLDDDSNTSTMGPHHLSEKPGNHKWNALLARYRAVVAANQRRRYELEGQQGVVGRV